MQCWESGRGNNVTSLYRIGTNVVVITYICRRRALQKIHFCVEVNFFSFYSILIFIIIFFYILMLGYGSRYHISGGTRVPEVRFSGTTQNQPKNVFKV